MQKLDFPDFQFHITEENGRLSIFDPVRKKYVALTPEEWVRQHVIRFLADEKNVPISLIGVEKEIRLYNTQKRFDVAVFDRNAKALLLVECKAPSVDITRQVLDQVVRYNFSLQVSYLMLTNGLKHIFCRIDIQTGMPQLIPELPTYANLC